eukprot:GHVT01047816.1.p2 GENE.GHVT01047816.1~~GHVT01047816.1.p2  ORF type:complete len:103 (+),score=17.73 GHVT01047816.1:1537-1845(+)
MGLAPSYADQKKFEAENGTDWDYKTYRRYMAANLHQEDSPDGFAEAFSLFDPSNTGELSKKQMMNILMTFGEPLTEKEAQTILADFPEPVNVSNFCAKIFAP